MEDFLSSTEKEEKEGEEITLSLIFKGKIFGKIKITGNYIKY